MPKFVMVFLLCAVMLSSLVIINVRHQHRLAYLAYQTQESDRDALNDEWGQLLVEENLWASAHRVEKHAGERLSMRAPKKEEVKIVGHESDSEQIAGGSHGAR